MIYEYTLLVTTNQMVHIELFLIFGCHIHIYNQDHIQFCLLSLLNHFY